MVTSKISVLLFLNHLVIIVIVVCKLLAMSELSTNKDTLVAVLAKVILNLLVILTDPVRISKNQISSILQICLC